MKKKITILLFLLFTYSIASAQEMKDMDMKGNMIEMEGMHMQNQVMDMNTKSSDIVTLNYGMLRSPRKLLCPQGYQDMHVYESETMIGRFLGRMQWWYPYVVAGLRYIVTKYISISSHYDSDMGLGAGLTFTY